MIDNSNYIEVGLKNTVFEEFPQKAQSLTAEFDKRLNRLFAENANVTDEKMRHLKGQILPGIAAYETLQTVMSKEDALGSGDSNPHWFHIAIFPVTAVNPLKIRQYSLRNLLCYRKNCLCETASTCSAEFLQRISVRKGADGLTPVKTDKAEGFVKIQSTGNAGSSPHCLSTVHGYVEKHAYNSRKSLKVFMCIPGLYRLVPGLFAKGVKKIFNEAAGFASNDIQTSGGVWRIDMVKCPYNDVCTKYGCPELCACFCDSDDITYDNLHKNLLWHRTKTLGKGGDCCDFCLKIKGR